MTAAQFACESCKVALNMAHPYCIHLSFGQPGVLRAARVFYLQSQAGRIRPHRREGCRDEAPLLHAVANEQQGFGDVSN